MLTKPNLNEHDFYGNPIIYRTKDEWGDIIVVDRNNCRVLAFDPIYEQSCIDLKNPHIPVHEYTRIMLLVLAFINPRHVTILGLGGGCLVHALHHIVPQCMLDSIELRKKVYEAAVNFFLMPTHHNINVTISDAKLALTLCEDRSTQIIFADMFKSYGMNPYQAQKRFIHECHRVLDDTGWLVVNYHQLPDLNSSFIQCLHKYFAELFVCPAINGNFVLFAKKCTRRTTNIHHSIVFDLENKLNIKLTHLLKRMIRIRTRKEIKV